MIQTILHLHTFASKSTYHQLPYFHAEKVAPPVKSLFFRDIIFSYDETLSHLIVNSANLLSDNLEAIWMIPLRDLFFLFFCKAVMSFIVSFCRLVCEAVTLEAKQLSAH